MLIRSPYLPPLILSEYSNFDSRMETGEFNSHHLLQDFVKRESLVHVSYITNHFRKKKHTILIFFSILFDNWSVPILINFVKYFWSQKAVKAMPTLLCDPLDT